MKKKIYDYLLLIPFVFYLFFAIYDGAIWCDDTPHYVYMSTVIEPLYPTFIALIRLLFSFTGDYLLIVAIIQSLLLAYAIWNISNYIIKEFKLKTIDGLITESIFLAVSLLCRFVAKRGSMYSNSIITEGICYPLFILFIRYCYEYINRKDSKCFIKALVLSLLLVLTRKQMYLSVALLILSVVYVSLSDRKYKKLIISCLVTCLLIFGGSAITNTIYTKLVDGDSGSHNGDNRFLTTVVIYASEKEDASFIKDESTRELFIKIYEECERRDILKNSISNDNWYKRVKHFSDSYDCIQLETLGPIAEEYLEEKYPNNNNYGVLKDKYDKEMVMSLLPSVLPKLISIFADSVLSGLMITISADKEIFIVYSIIVYLLYIALLIINIKKNGFDNYALFSIFSLLSTIINVCFVSLVIFCQTRYMIYNMPLFYISMYLLLINLINKKRLTNC